LVHALRGQVLQVNTWTVRTKPNQPERYSGELLTKCSQQIGSAVNPFRERTDFRGILGIATRKVPHRCEDRVPFTSQGFGEYSAEAGAGAGDESYLLGIHDHPSLRLPWAGLMPEVKQLVTKLNSTECGSIAFWNRAKSDIVVLSLHRAAAHGAEVTRRLDTCNEQ
jgi:hypothetical protein